MTSVHKEESCIKIIHEAKIIIPGRSILFSLLSTVLNTINGVISTSVRKKVRKTVNANAFRAQIQQLWFSAFVFLMRSAIQVYHWHVNTFMTLL